MPIALRRTDDFDFESGSWSLVKTNVLDGDCVLWVAVTDTDHGISAVPSGFTNFGTGTDDVPDSSLTVIGKYVSSIAGEGAWDLDFAVSETGSARRLCYTGVDPSTPFDTNRLVEGATFASDSPTTGSVTPAGPNRLIVCGYGSDPAAAVSLTNATAGFTSHGVYNHPTGTTAFIYTEDLQQTSAAAVNGAPTFSAADRYNKFVIPLITAGAAAPSGDDLMLLGVS